MPVFPCQERFRFMAFETITIYRPDPEDASLPHPVDESVR